MQFLLYSLANLSQKFIFEPIKYITITFKIANLTITSSHIFQKITSLHEFFTESSLKSDIYLQYLLIIREKVKRRCVISLRITKKRHVVATIILCCLAFIFGISLLTRESSLQSNLLLPSSKKMLASHVKVCFVTHDNKLLKTYYWSTSHAKKTGSDITDIFNSDIIEAHSGINNHIPMDYQYDQTDLKNVRTLKNVRLGNTIKLVVTKLDSADRPSGVNRLFKWLTTG